MGVAEYGIEFNGENGALECLIIWEPPTSCAPPEVREVRWN